MCSEGELQNRRVGLRRLGAMAAASAIAAVFAPMASATDGTIAYMQTDGYQVPFTLMPWNPRGSDPRIQTADAGGGPSRRLFSDAMSPAWSPAGDQIAFAGAFESRDDGQIVVARPDGSGRRAVTRASVNWSDEDPAWSPDGRRLVFQRSGQELYTVSAAGGRARRLTRGGSWDREASWGPDDRISFARFSARRWRIFTVAADGTGARAITSGPANDREPSWSPDGSRIAFARETDDRIDIYTMLADGTDLRRVTNAGPDEAYRSPAWSSDGAALAYSAWGPYGNDHEILITDLASGATRRLTDNRHDDLNPVWRSAAALAIASGPLKKRRRRLPGLAGWIGTPQEGNGSECQAYRPFLPSEPLLTFHTHQSFAEVRHGGRQEIGTRGFTCAYGFPRSRRSRYRVTLTHPDGSVERLQARDSGPGTSIAYWVARRGAEGAYHVEVVQGTRRARMTFRVVPADSPHLVVPDPDERSEVVRRLGQNVPILLTGLAPDTRVWLDLYRGARRRQPPPPACRECPPLLELGHRYFNSVRVRSGADGTVLYQLPTTRDDRPGQYLVMLRVGRRQVSGAEFVLRRSPQVSKQARPFLNP